MTELEKATAILATALGVADTEVAETLKTDEAVEAVTAQFETKYKDQRDHGNKQAIGKSRRDVERAFKAAGVEDVSFDNIPAAIEALQSKSTTASVKDLSPDEVLKLKPVVDALNAERLKTESAVEAARVEERTKLAEKEQSFRLEQTKSRVQTEAEKLVDKLNPNFTKPSQRAKLIKEIVDMGGYQLDEKGNILLVDADGNLVDGKMGNPAKFEDRVREYVDEYYGLPVSSPKDSPGLTPKDAASASAVSDKKYQGEMPKTQAEYAALLPTLTSDQQKEVQAWRKTEKPF